MCSGSKQNCTQRQSRPALGLGMALQGSALMLSWGPAGVWEVEFVPVLGLLLALVMALLWAVMSMLVRGALLEVLLVFVWVFPLLVLEVVLAWVSALVLELMLASVLVDAHGNLLQFVPLVLWHGGMHQSCHHASDSP